MLYPKNSEPRLSPQLFKSPPAEYRATPFWAWNCSLDEDLLLREIDYMKRMGLGGFHMHSRSGMALPYLGEDFMARVQACVEKARKENMLAWLYDEDRWPSGAAGGYVTKEKKYRARHLLFTSSPYGTKPCSIQNAAGSHAAAKRNENGTLLAQYKVELDADGCLKSYRRVENDGDWYAYLEIAMENPWFNNQTYLDTLNPEAVRAFIEVTHERYKEDVGRDFGGVIPAIFTDEPQFTHKRQLAFATEKADLILPWTGNFPDTYLAAYGEDILDKLPEIFWDLPDAAPSLSRYRYHDHVAERFAAAFSDECGEWCKNNGIMLTGHMMEEPTLLSQTVAIGDAMRSYRSFQLPGIDMLCDQREYTTAKQAQSAVRQFGYPGVLSELYGVTNWDFDFRGHKLQGDWQAALGVTVRVPHLYWASMAGEAKRDYPAAIGHQSPWYEEYPLIEDHFARVNTAMTRGKARVRVAVVHPVESYWLRFGPNEQSALQREDMDRRFQNLTSWLLLGQVDFDFLAESLLPLQVKEAGAPLTVGEMTYDCVILPWCDTLRSTTLEILEKFARAGGNLITLGVPPRYIDAIKDPRGAMLCKTSIPYDRASVLAAVEKYRDIQVRDAKGRLTDNLLYQMRQDGQDRILFLCHGTLPQNADIAQREDIMIHLSGLWSIEELDTMTGVIRPREDVCYDRDHTITAVSFYAHDSLLWRLTPIAYPGAGVLTPFKPVIVTEAGLDLGKVKVELSEPNVLVLDIAEYRLDDGPWQPAEELLRADNDCRRQLGWPLRMESFAQPWVVPDEPLSHCFNARFTIDSDIEIVTAHLALEDAERVKIHINGKEILSAIDGCFTDESIKTVPLPILPAGRNVIELFIPMGKRTNIEWCYLLGNFGVQLEGARARLTKPVGELNFGDITRQGLPFYAGNVTYRLPFVMEDKGDLCVRTPHYRGALIGVSLNKKRIGSIAFAPYSYTIKDLPPGEYEIGLTLFGNRYNAFGQLHNANETMTWFGPNSWRTVGDAWTYDYRVKRTGILSRPAIEPIYE